MTENDGRGFGSIAWGVINWLRPFEFFIYVHKLINTKASWIILREYYKLKKQRKGGGGGIERSLRYRAGPWTFVSGRIRTLNQLFLHSTDLKSLFLCLKIYATYIEIKLHHKLTSNSVLFPSFVTFSLSLKEDTLLSY